MLQTLLAQRFKLTIRRESRVAHAYVLTVAKNGPKLEKSAGGETNVFYGRGRIDARSITLDALAERLGRHLDLPVVNRTGLDGAFNILLEWTPDESRETDKPSIFTAVQQFGLRIAAQRVPVQVIVVDHAEKPSEN